MTAPAQKRLNQLQRRQQVLLQRLKKQEAQLRDVLKAGGNELRMLNRQIEDQKYAVLIKLLRETGMPMDNTALVIGMALEAKDLLQSADEPAKAEMINRYTSRYMTFEDAKRRAEEARKEAEKEASPVPEEDYPPAEPMQAAAGEPW